MPRDVNGVYTLPAGNPVLTSTPISSTWANTTLQDIRDMLTTSLDRTGVGPMLAPLRAIAGTNSAPGISFGGTSSGISVSGVDLRFGINGIIRAALNQNGTALFGLAGVGSVLPLGFNSAIYARSDDTPGVFVTNQDANTAAIWAQNASSSGDSHFINFATETTGLGTVRGRIDYNRGGGLTRYNTTSDYRLKDIEGPVTDALDALMKLLPHIGRMKEATESRPMFVAHELQEVAPYAVSGVKDQVDDNGQPVYQQVDVSSLVPLIVAAIQELSRKLNP